MQTRPRPLFRKLVSTALILQFTLAPLAQAQPSTPEEARELANLRAEQNVQIEELVNSLEGRGVVGAKLDTWRLLDQTNLSPRGTPKWIRPSEVGVVVLSQRPDRASGLALQTRGITFLEVETREIVTSTRVGNRFYFVEKTAFDVNSQVQQISFIDLDAFEPALGKVKIPVFSLAVHSTDPVLSVSAHGSDLLVETTAGTLRLPESAQLAYSQINNLLFSAESRAIDPTTYEDAAPLTNGLIEAFDQALNAAGDSATEQIIGAIGSEEALRNHFSSLQARATTQANLTGAIETANDPSGLVKANHAEIESAIRTHKAAIMGSRKFFARVGRLWSRFTLPNPMGAPTIEGGLARIAGAFRSDRAKLKQEILQGTLEIAQHPIAKRGGPVAAAMLAGVLAPTQSSEFIRGAISVSHNVFGVLYGKTSDAFAIAGASAEATFAFLKSGVIYNTYLAPENIGHFGVALTAITATLGVTLMLPHVLVNLGYLAHDVIKMDRETVLSPRARTTLFEKLKAAFPDLRELIIARQNMDEKAYLEALSGAEDGGEAVKEWSDKQTADLHELLKELEAQEAAQAGPVKKMIYRMKQTSLFKRFERSDRTSQEITSFGHALRHLLFSQAAFTHFGVATAKFWNVVFAVRSFAWNPSLLFLYTLFPRFMPVVATARGRVTLPTEYNGGILSAIQLAKRALFNKDTLELTRKFEDQVIAAEAELHAAALRAATDATIRYSNSLKITQSIYEQGGILSVNSPLFAELNWKQRAFFRNYFDDVFGRSLKLYLARFAGLELGVSETDSISDADLKKRVVRLFGERLEENSEGGFKLELAKADAEKLVAEVANEEAFTRNRPALNAHVLAQTASEHLKYGVMRKLNPERNMQVFRIQVVKNKLEEPRAVARATRSLVANFLVDKPMELALAFLLVAGVSEGVLKPLHPEMFGPNSWFHMSRVVFLSGFIANTITGVAAFTWLKIQQDSGNSEELLNQVPDADAPDKGFFRHYLSKTFNNKDNTLWANQRHYLKIIMANMKSYLILAILMQLPTLGRLDVDMFLNGYLMAVLIPMGGIGFKLEQGFEMSVGYYARQIPKELRSHPEALRYVMKRAQGARIKFNVFNKLFENVVGQVMLTAETIRVNGIGTRAMARWIFGGYTPTELVALGSGAIKNVVGGNAAVAGFIDSCTRLLTNNYTDGQPGISIPGAAPPSGSGPGQHR